MGKKGLPKLKIIVASLKDKSRAGHAPGGEEDPDGKLPLHEQAMKEMHQSNVDGDHAGAVEAFRALLGHIMSGASDSDASEPEESLAPSSATGAESDIED